MLDRALFPVHLDAVIAAQAMIEVLDEWLGRLSQRRLDFTLRHLPLERIFECPSRSIVAKAVRGLQTRTARGAWRNDWVRGQSIEHQHRARDLARLHRTEGLVDVLEPPVAAHHVVEVEAALPIEIEILGHVEAETIGAHVAALDSFFDEEVTGVELDLLPRRNCADQRRGAARREAVKGLLRHLPAADRLE